MPISATGTRRTMPLDHPSDSHREPSAATRRRGGEAGLSLVEVLVTLSISAFAAVLIVATARPADPLRSEGERLTRTLEQLDGRARISGKPTGLVVQANGYAGMVWSEGEWSPLPRSQRSLGPAAEIRSPLARDVSAREEKRAARVPQLVFDPLGHSKIEPIILRAKDRELAIALPDRGAP